MRFLITIFALIFAINANAGFRGVDANGKQVGIYADFKCATGLTCTDVNHQFNVAENTQGPLRVQVQATAVAITTAQCGSTFISGNASVAMTLPVAATSLGCRLTFITGSTGKAFTITPVSGTQILVETATASHSAVNATTGDSLTLEAIDATHYAPISVIGTYVDTP